MISNFELIKRLFTSFLAMFLPFIIYFVCGDLKSISQSWETELQPLFIFTNALVSYFFFDLPKWRVPALLLLLLTVFSVEDWFILHNILAVLFFIVSAIPLWSLKKFRFYLPIYLVSVVFLFFDGFYWMETWAILTLGIYHVHLMLFTRKIISRQYPDRFR
jgi:hypothetical protein